MQSLSNLLALFLATSVVVASPVDFQRFAKRQEVVDVVWVTVTSTDFITISTQSQFTETVTVHHHSGLSHSFSGTPSTVAVASDPVEDPVAAPIPTAAPAPAPAPTTTTSADPPAVAADADPATVDPPPTTTDPAPITPDPTPTTPDPPATTAPPVATTAAPASSGSEDPPVDVMYSGQGTYFSPGYVILCLWDCADFSLGACGDTNTDEDFICALGHSLFDSIPNGGNPNNSPLCGRKIQAYYGTPYLLTLLIPILGSNTVTVTAVDRCEACQEYDLDFSPAAFDQLADESLGRQVPLNNLY